MARPRKYASDADRQAARRQSDAARKRKKRAPESAARNALKNDPTKRKDAAVNAEAYPVAPTDADTLEMINAILDVAGDLSWAGGAMRARTREIEKTCIALVKEWEAENLQRLPMLEEAGEKVLWNYVAEGSNGPVQLNYSLTFGERWNKFLGTLRLLAFFDERNSKNHQKKQRHAAKEIIEAEAAGLTVEKLRTRKDVTAKRKWEDKTQAAYHRAKSDEALAKRKARSDRDSTERMEQHDTFGRF